MREISTALPPTPAVVSQCFDGLRVSEVSSNNKDELLQVSLYSSSAALSDNLRVHTGAHMVISSAAAKHCNKDAALQPSRCATRGVGSLFRMAIRTARRFRHAASAGRVSRVGGGHYGARTTRER